MNRAREKEGWKTWTGCVLGIAGAGGIESGMAVGMQNTGSAEATENDDLPEIAESGDERLSTLSGKIRVLLMDSGYQSYYHSSVTLNLNGADYEYTPDSPNFPRANLSWAAEKRESPSLP